MRISRRSEVRATRLVDARVETVWQLYDDVAELSRWAPNIVAAAVIGGGPKRLGASVQTTMRMGPLKLRFDEEVVRYEPTRKSVLRGHLPGWTYEMDLELRSEDGKTRCEYACVSQYALPLRAFTPLLDRMNRGMLEEALSALKSAAETRQQQADEAQL